MSNSEVLFSITSDHLDIGLRGIPVGRCPTSQVDPQKGLSYRGYTIDQLADKCPEEVLYLLFNGELPNHEQVAEYKKLLEENSRLDKEVIEHLKGLPKSGHPMKWFLSGINVMGMLHGTGDYKKDALAIVAKMPEMVAALFRIRSGWGEPLPSKPELGYMENFAQMMGVPGSNQHFGRLMRVFNILHYDHGGGNLSTFVGKAIASGREDLYGSLVGAMAGLAGPLHGKANQECLKFLRTIQENVSDPTDEEAMAAFLKAHFEAGGKIFGFGHAVLRIEDPRATLQYALGEEIAKEDPLFRLGVTLRKVGVEFLKKQTKISNPYPNVDAISGVLLHSAGLTDETYYTVLFGLSRCMGIASQIVYERTEARNGKGTPIVRPKYLYSGSTR